MESSKQTFESVGDARGSSCLKAGPACMNEYLYCSSIEQSDSKGKFTVRCSNFKGLPFSFKLRNQQFCLTVLLAPRYVIA